MSTHSRSVHSRSVQPRSAGARKGASSSRLPEQDPPAATTGVQRPSGRPQADRLLRQLAGDGAFATPAAAGGRFELDVFARRNGVSLRVAGAMLAEAGELASAGAAIWTEGRTSGRRTLALTPEGHARARRLLAENAQEEFLAQHLELANADVVTGGLEKRVRIDETESPLAWLANRRDASGRKLIGEAEFQAGERLRIDLTRAQNLPRITANWTAEVASGARGAGSMNVTEQMIAARQRVERALDAAGPEFSGLLIDVCGFLKGLELVESERGWPRRSAKLVLEMALKALARHYGYRETIAGRASAAGLRHWGADNYRPDIGPLQQDSV